MRSVIRLALAMFVLIPSTALAQGSITGVVRDSSGAVLPGVTVEATSDALIEKVRTSITDSNGQYRIVDLRAGTYAVTFSLQGFSTYRRDGIVIEGVLTATVHADMKVGTLQETIVVTGESPMVDVQSVRRQTVMDNETISAIPAARGYANLMQLMPNTVTAGGGAMDTQIVPGMVVFGGAGGRGNEGRVNVDGISVGSAFNGAGVSSYIADVGNAREITLISSGGLGEVEGGGPAINLLPKEGGNTVRGSFYAAAVTSGMVGSNYSDELRTSGLAVPGEVRKVWDFNLGVGGPIARDRLWFFGTLREEGMERGVPGMFANANAGDPTKWTYVADTSRPAFLAASYRMMALRLTSQLTPRNKIAVFWDEQQPCEGGAAPGFGGSACRKSGDTEIFAGSTAAPTPSANPTNAPETAAYRDYGNRVNQAKWTSPVTNRLLLEAGYGSYRSRWGGKNIPGLDTRDLIRVNEACAGGCAANGGIAGLNYRSGNWGSHINWNTQWNAAASFVTGSHSVKVGYQGALLYDDRKNFSNSQFLSYRVNNAVPDQLTMSIGEYGIRQRVRSDAFYAQEQWTMGRMTLQGALRYDHAWSWFPEQQVGPVRFLPTPLAFPHTTGVEGYHDLWPRGGVAYDVFGTGRTSVKVNFGRYLEAAQNAGFFTTLNPTGRLSTTASRSWQDDDRDYVPDCNLLINTAQGTQTPAGGVPDGLDFCGANTNANFGTPVFATTLDPELFSGWGIRTGDWQVGASIQQEVLPRVAVELGYQRRWLVNFATTDNRARAADEHTKFDIIAPTDSRLPGGGGYTISGFYNPTATAAARLNDNFETLASNYAERSQVANSINMNVTARPRWGLVMQGGFNTAKTNSDSCALRDLLPETALTSPYCSDTSGWVTRFTALGTYTIPRIDVQVAGTMRSDQGPELGANWAAPNSATVGLNRPFAGIAGQTITVNLIEPGTLYGERINQLDLRFAKILRFGRTRTNVGFDISNVMNAAPTLSYNQTFVTPAPTSPTQAWLRPNSVLQARFVKFSAQVDF
jgi:hypothetical protein